MRNGVHILQYMVGNPRESGLVYLVVVISMQWIDPVREIYWLLLMIIHPSKYLDIQ